jgi:hypothetical protein
MAQKIPCPTRQTNAGIRAIRLTICSSVKLFSSSFIGLFDTIFNLCLPNNAMSIDKIPTTLYGIRQSAHQTTDATAIVPAARSNKPMIPNARPCTLEETSSTNIV